LGPYHTPVNSSWTHPSMSMGSDFRRHPCATRANVSIPGSHSADGVRCLNATSTYRACAVAASSGRKPRMNAARKPATVAVARAVGAYDIGLEAGDHSSRSDQEPRSRGYRDPFLSRPSAGGPQVQPEISSFQPNDFWSHGKQVFRQCNYEVYGYTRQRSAASLDRESKISRRSIKSVSSRLGMKMST